MPCYPPKQVYGLGTKIARGGNHLELSKLEGAIVTNPSTPFLYSRGNRGLAG